MSWSKGRISRNHALIGHANVPNLTLHTKRCIHRARFDSLDTRFYRLEKGSEKDRNGRS